MDETAATRSQTTGGASLSIAIVEAIAERAAVDPLDLDRPLYDVIDPEAVARLFPVDGDGRPVTEGHLNFTYGPYTVRVYSDRRVDVFGPGDDGPDPTATGGP